MSSGTLLVVNNSKKQNYDPIVALSWRRTTYSTITQAACVAMGDLDETDCLIEQRNDLLPAEPLLIVADSE